MNVPYIGLDRGSAGYLQLSREAIDRILEATAGCPHSAVRCAVAESLAGALLQFVFNDLMNAAFFGSQPPAKRLQSIERAIDRIRKATTVTEKGKYEAQLQRQLVKLSCLAFPPKLDPFDLDWVCRWLDAEQEAKRGGGRPPNDWAARADIKLLAGYELIFGRTASSGLDGPTMRFLRSFFEQGHKELTRSAFRFDEERSQLLGLWSCGNDETLRIETPQRASCA